MYRNLRFFAFLCCTTAFTSTVAAQGTGIVEGQITDETGGVLPGVSVDLHSGATELEVVTDGEGRYRFDSVPTGPAAPSGGPST
jgi:hypothetical protein